MRPSIDLVDGDHFHLVAHWPSQFAWSSAGPIAGKKCTQILEGADPHTWSDNYFCWTQDHGKKNPNIQWRSWGLMISK